MFWVGWGGRGLTATKRSLRSARTWAVWRGCGWLAVVIVGGWCVAVAQLLCFRDQREEYAFMSGQYQKLEGIPKLNCNSGLPRLQQASSGKEVPCGRPALNVLACHRSGLHSAEASSASMLHSRIYSLTVPSPPYTTPKLTPHKEGIEIAQHVTHVQTRSDDRPQNKGSPQHC